MNNHPKGKMTLPTTKSNSRDIEWYLQECAWMQVELKKLKTENAALREDKQRLLYLSERWNPKNDFRNDEIGKWIVIGDHNSMIAAIDAARKEAQP